MSYPENSGKIMLKRRRERGRGPVATAAYSAKGRLAGSISE